MFNDVVNDLIKKHPNHYIHPDVVFGVPVLMFYTIYPGDDPSCPHPCLEDHFVVTREGIPAEWVPDTEIKHMEDKIFAAHTKRGKQCVALG